MQRIGDYRYPAEGSLADKVGTWGTFWRPAMRTADGDRKVATWALQLPVSRCLPALGNASQLVGPCSQRKRTVWANGRRCGYGTC